MNKSILIIVISLFALFNGNAQNDTKWNSAKKLTTLIADGAIPSTVIERFKEEYNVLIADDSNLIVALQDSEGGCVIIFPSPHKFAFFHKGKIVTSPPVSATGSNQKPILWKKAILDTKKSNKDFLVLRFHRKDDSRTDSATLNRTDSGSLVNWKFDILD